MNRVYDVARFKFATAGINWNTAALRVLAYSDDPIFFPADTQIADITARAVTTLVSTSQPVTGKNVTTQGYLQTGNIVFPLVPIGLPITHMIIVDMPAAIEVATPLIYIDDAYDLPFVPNGLDVVVTPDWLQQRGWGRL